MNTPQCKIFKGLAANATSHGPVEQGAPMDRHVSGSGLFLRRLSWTPRKKPGVAAGLSGLGRAIGRAGLGFG